MNRLPKKRCIAFFGAGAVENAWTPVSEAVSEYAGFPVSPENANFVFANLVHALRTLSHIAESPEWKTTDRQEKLSEPLNSRLHDLAKLKAMIAANIQRDMTRDKLKARPGVISLISDLAADHEFCFVNTNWDTAVDHALHKRTEALHDGLPTLHIHGHFRNSQHLYLPTETSYEPYFDQSMLNYSKELHGRIIAGGLQSHTAVFYGLSLSALDPELGTVVAAALNHQEMERIVIVGLRQDKAAIEGRIRLLLNPAMTSPEIEWQAAEELS